jgi:hypothetical protein
MNGSKNSHHGYGVAENNIAQQGHTPYWKRAHRDWRIWVAVSLMITGMIIYVMSEDLSVRPQGRLPLPSGAVGR